MATELRWLADEYEQAQRVRIETGERIRAVLQSRDQTFNVEAEWNPTAYMVPAEDPEAEPTIDADAVLKAISNGTSLGPVNILGRTFKRMMDQERDMQKEMTAALQSHPAFPWLDRVKGIGPTLACKMLARFDVNKAEYASSFWAYAGLATEPGNFYRCAECGLERSFPVGYNVTGKHQVGGAGKQCKGALVLVPEKEVRVAQVHARAGQKATYDAYAKKIMYLVASSFLKSKGPYEQHYRKQRERLDRERPHWADGRRHLTALRIVEKLFLAHLWQVWRTAENLPTPMPWVVAHAGHDMSSIIDPWEMVEPEEVPKAKKPKTA